MLVLGPTGQRKTMFSNGESNIMKAEPEQDEQNESFLKDRRWSKMPILGGGCLGKCPGSPNVLKARPADGRGGKFRSLLASAFPARENFLFCFVGGPRWPKKRHGFQTEKIT